jgi:hypothetical protein
MIIGKKTYAIIAIIIVLGVLLRFSLIDPSMAGIVISLLGLGGILTNSERVNKKTISK